MCFFPPLFSFFILSIDTKELQTLQSQWEFGMIAGPSDSTCFVFYKHHVTFLGTSLLCFVLFDFRFIKRLPNMKN